MSMNFESTTTDELRSETHDAAAALSSAQHEAPPTPNVTMDRLSARLKRHKVTRIGIEFLDRCADIHLKDLVIDDMDDHRRVRILGREVVNFGSGSFLGLDRDERVQKALIEALPTWGSHNGALRAFSSVALYNEAEQRLARW